MQYLPTCRGPVDTAVATRSATAAYMYGKKEDLVPFASATASQSWKTKETEVVLFILGEAVSKPSACIEWPQQSTHKQAACAQTFKHYDCAHIVAPRLISSLLFIDRFLHPQFRLTRTAATEPTEAGVHQISTRLSPCHHHYRNIFYIRVHSFAYSSSFAEFPPGRKLDIVIYPLTRSISGARHLPSTPVCSLEARGAS